MSYRRQAQQLALRLAAIRGEVDICRRAAARELAGLHPSDVTGVLEELMRLYHQGFEPAQSVLASVLSAFSPDSWVAPSPESLRRVATLQEQATVAELLASGAPKKEMTVDAAMRADARQFTDSLGHLKTKARICRDADELARLAAMSHPAVVQNLLLNPRLTEEWVVRMAARRPVRPEPLIEIWRCARWSSRPAVRRALVLNPYLPLEVASKLVPLLGGAELSQLSIDTSVHPVIREQACSLLKSFRSPGAKRPD